ncbi:MAG: hypothetical protein JRG91_10945 [Deltaproteobacteria bacterium]|nr:hypothetical protein [Deltaproteobacteria bacterium]
MSHRLRHLSTLCLLLALLACGRIEPVDPDASDDSSTEPAADSTTDTGPDPRIDVTGDCPPVRIPFEAEDMTLTGFVTDTSTRPEIGDYIYSETNTARASIDIGIPCTDEYVLWGLVWWEDDSNDSVFWEWDSSGTPMVWDFLQCSGTTPRWHWDQVTGRPDSMYCREPAEDPEIFVLTEGDHTFALTNRELYSTVAEFVLTNDMSYTPPFP